MKAPSYDARTHRAGRRFLVRLALQCRSAEELGLRLRRRYEQQQRQGIATGRSRQAEADRLLAQITRPHCTVIQPRRLKARLVLVG